MQLRVPTLALLTAIAAALPGCGAPTAEVPPAGAIATIDVIAPTTTLVPGATAQLTAVARDADGALVTDRALAWTSSAPAVATVSATGLVTALGPGEVTIEAAADQVAGALLLTVDAPPGVVTELALDPAGPLTLAPGARLALTAIARDADGAVVPDPPIAWASDADPVATVSATGELVAIAAGAAIISASCDGAVARLAVTVAADSTTVATVRLSEPGPVVVFPGDGHGVRARGHAADGSEVPGRPVTWTTADPAIAIVEGDGLIVGVAEGTTRATATIDGQRASIDVIVTPVGIITLAPGEAVLPPGGELALTHRMFDGYSQPIVRPLTWTSDRPAIATVDATGRITALAPGVATITAATPGRRASMRVSVVAGGAHVLTTIDGQPLPAELVRLDEPAPGGGTRVARTVITDGGLTVSHADGRYALQLWGHILRDGEPPVLTSFDLAGTVVWDAATGRTQYLTDDGLVALDGVMDAAGGHLLRMTLGEPAVLHGLGFLPQ